jgi:hypothetical protein
LPENQTTTDQTMLQAIGLAEKYEVDDPRALPGRFVTIWKTPYRSFGLDERTADISNVRDAFRKLCLSYIPHFMDLGNPKLSLEQVVFAYHKIRGHLKGTAKAVADGLPNNPYMDFQAQDILPLLRPMRSSFPCAKEYRACRMLTVEYISSSFKFGKDSSYVSLPSRSFLFEVHYCMRKQSIELTYQDILNQHEILSNELVAIPVFPALSYYEYLLDNDVIGPKLAEYLTRIHHMLAGKGMFSARLLRFIGLDFERVQSEEEGIIMSVLDSAGKSRSSAYHLIDEGWLVKWRKFVMGRGARRYFPPGRITNQVLLDKLKAESKQRNLRIVKDYRVVNYNVYRFYELVHGGGPVISRKEEDIYSPYAVSYLQAVIHIQSRIRIFLAKVAREKLYSKSLLKSKPVRTILLSEAKKELTARVESKIRSYQDKRKNEKLREAAMMTQSKWRQKKKYFPEENLKRQRRDQTVFSTVSQMLMNENPGTYGDGIVYEEPLPIVRIGCTSIFERKLDEEMGMIPFQVKRVPGSNTAVVWKCDQFSTEFPIGSKLVSINQYPCSGMDMQTVLDKLKTVAWPLYLELEKPVKVSLMPTMDTIISLENERIQYSAFKFMLTRGLRMERFSEKNKTFGGPQCHETIVRLSEFEFFYKASPDPTKPEATQWRGLNLFTTKFVRGGRDPGSVFEGFQKAMRKTKPLDRDLAFSLVFDEKEIHFLATPQQDFFSSVSSVYTDKGGKGTAASGGGGGPNNSLADHESFVTEEQNKQKLQSASLRSKYISKIKEVRNNVQADLRRAALAKQAGNNPTPNNNAKRDSLAANIKASPRVVEDLVDDADSAEDEDEPIQDSWDPDRVMKNLVSKGLLSNGIASSAYKDETEIYNKLYGATLVMLFQKLVDEVRKSQVAIDESGMPVKLVEPKKALRNTAKKAGEQ